MNAAIFAVVSPLQYINALEAIHAFGLAPEQCYLALGESKKLPATGRQVRSLIDPKMWRAIQSVEGFPAAGGINRAHKELLHFFGARQYAKAANSLIRRARQECGSIEHVFLGDYRPLNFRHFIGAIPEAQVWLLDDGSVTHQVVRFRKDPDSPHLYAKPFARSNALNLVRSKASGLRFGDPKQLGYFTCYDVEPPARDTVRRHDYAYYRSRYPTIEPISEVWFLGANHVENKFTTAKKYKALLERVRDFYRGEKVVYLPHRGESEKKVASLAELGFELRNFDLPIEIAIGQTGQFPRVLSGIASSAIDNLSVILGSRVEVHVFCVGTDYAPGERWNHLKDVIDYHRRDVFGLTTFVYESDSGRYRGPVRDYRLPSTIERDQRTTSGGYYWTAEGCLRGPLPCRVEVETGTGKRQLRVQSLRPGANNDLRVGDAVLLRPDVQAGALLGQVTSLPLAGCVVVELDPEREPLAPAWQERWTLEKLERRREHFPGRGNAGVIFEPESENLLEKPRDWDSPDWAFCGVQPFGRGSMTDSRVVLSPEGESSAALLQLDETVGAHSLERVVAAGGAGAPVSWSVFVRYGGCESIELFIEHLDSRKSTKAEYRLSPAPDQVGLHVSVHGELEGRARQRAFDSGWVRCSISAELPPGRIRVGVRLALRSEFEFAGDGCSGVYLWGPQLERTPVATSPILPFAAAPPRRGGESFEVAVLENTAACFIECSLPDTSAPITLLSLGTEIQLTLDAAKGEVRLRRGPAEIASAVCGPIGADEPFVIALSKRDATLEVLVNGTACSPLLACDPERLAATLGGGPFHLRRSFLHRGDLPAARVVELCSVAGLNEL